MMYNTPRKAELYDPFDCLCEALDIGPQDIVAMFVAFFDESYNQYNKNRPNEPLVYTVACGLAPKDQWSKLAVRWRSALRRKPAVDHFHMTDFENRVGQFRAWSESGRIERLQRLHGIIRDHISYVSTSTVNRADFDAIPLKRRSKPDIDYYLFNVISCMDAITEWCDAQNMHEPIHYVFAYLDKQGGLLDKWFSTCLETPNMKKDYRMSGTWSKGIMKDLPQLQAVDIIAYESCKRAANYASDGSQVVRKSLDIKFTEDRCDAVYYGKEAFDKWLSKPPSFPFGPIEPS